MFLSDPWYDVAVIETNDQFHSHPHVPAETFHDSDDVRIFPSRRHEIDQTQELNYPFIMQAIVDLGYTGFVSHEYSPSPGKDPVQALEKAIEICDV